ncbi:MAG: DUF134 domain-containing protein [Candidatus Thorarchaeota archaeon]|nr:DUF134 domain-containing protein [Candidatus Thorarchaeota archaeon]
MMHRRRRGSRGRFPIQPIIKKKPGIKQMTPEPQLNDEPIYLDLAEVEVLRLVDLDGLYQEDAGLSMGLSRGTVWRLLASARRKLLLAIFEGRPLVIGQLQTASD